MCSLYWVPRASTAKCLNRKRFLGRHGASEPSTDAPWPRAVPSGGPRISPTCPLSSLPLQRYRRPHTTGSPQGGRGVPKLVSPMPRRW
ncbi:hypothetical protein ECG_06900 [Echinococcus granulosus]|nr:hypothetical protein ECG_06900 [Echinococcus granulosus]